MTRMPINRYIGRGASLGTIFTSFLLLMGCCHVNKLPQNLPRIKSVLVVPMITGGVSVHLSSPKTGNALLDIVGGVATASASIRTRNKILRATSAERLLSILRNAFTRMVAKSLKLRPVYNPRHRHDAELHVVVKSYGIRSYSPTLPVRYFFNSEARLVTLPDRRLIWRDCKLISGPLTPYILYGNYRKAQMVGTITGISALSSLSHLQLTAMFDRIAYQAGRRLAARMYGDAFAPPTK